MEEEWIVVVDQTAGYGGRKSYFNKVTGQTTFDKPDHLKSMAEIQRDVFLRNGESTMNLNPLDFSDLTSPSSSSSSSMNQAISSSNVGFQMLQKYGWNEEKGLGKDEKGIVAPVQLKGTDALLGHTSTTTFEDAEDQAVSEVTRDRRKLDIELEQTSDMLARKAGNAAREEQIENDLKLMHHEFYCEWCDKQYKNVSEMSSHLSSYDHHHTKRLKELKRAEKKRVLSSGPQEDDLRRKEVKRAMRDIEKRTKQMTDVMNQMLPSSSQEEPHQNDLIVDTSTSVSIVPTSNSIPDTNTTNDDSNLSLAADRAPVKLVKFGLKMNMKKK